MRSTRLSFDDLKNERGEYIPPRESVAAKAQIIADAFIAAKTSFTGKASSIPKKSHKKFYEAALLSEELGETPEEFANRQLTAMTTSGVFWPNTIASLQLRTANADENIRTLFGYYKSQLLTFEARSALFGYKETLTDVSAPFSPLFRYAMAWQEGFDDVMKTYESAARSEYLSDSFIDSLFGFVRPHLL